LRYTIPICWFVSGFDPAVFLVQSSQMFLDMFCLLHSVGKDVISVNSFRYCVLFQLVVWFVCE